MNSDFEVLCCIYASADERTKYFNLLLKSEYSAALTYVMASQLSIAKHTRLSAKTALTRRNIAAAQLKEAVPHPKSFKTPAAAKPSGDDGKKLAENLIKDSTAQVIAISKSLNENSNCSADVKSLAEKTIELENLFMARLRGFL